MLILIIVIITIGVLYIKYKNPSNNKETSEKTEFSKEQTVDSLKTVGAMMKNYAFTGDVDKEVSLEVDPNDEAGELKKSLKQGRYYYTLAGLCVIASILPNQLVMFIKVYVGRNFLVSILSVAAGIFMIVMVITAIYFFYKGKNAKKDTSKMYEDEILRPAIQSILPNAVVKYQEHLDIELLINCGAIPYHEESSGSCLVQYENPQEKFCFSNLHLWDKRENGKGETVRETVFKGQVYGLKFKTCISGAVRIFTTERFLKNGPEVSDYAKGHSDEEKIETESQIFNEGFDVYATDSASAFYVLSPYVMEQLIALKNRYSRVSVAIMGDDFFIAVNTNENLFQIPKKYEEIEAISVEKSKAEFGEVFNFAHILKNSIEGNIRDNFTNTKMDA